MTKRLPWLGDAFDRAGPSAARAAMPRSRRSRSGPRRCSGRRRDRGARADLLAELDESRHAEPLTLGEPGFE